MTRQFTCRDWTVTEILYIHDNGTCSLLSKDGTRCPWNDSNGIGLYTLEICLRNVDAGLWEEIAPQPSILMSGL